MDTSNSGEAASAVNAVDAAGMGPVARMMMNVAAQAITSYVQFQSLVDLLVERGIISGDALEQHFAARRERDLDRTIDEWFPPDIAYHLKVAIQLAAQEEAAPSGEADGLLAVDTEEMVRARAMQTDCPGEPGDPGRSDKTGGSAS